MKNSNDTIGNRTRDLPTCSTVPQPTALPRDSYGGGCENYRILGYDTMQFDRNLVNYF